MSWHTLLVLGGTGSGKQEYAQSRTAGTTRRLTADRSDGGGLTGLAGALAAAGPDETLLVEDLTGWLPTPGRGRPEPPAGLDELVAALTATPARVVLVSSELGLAGGVTAAGARSAELVGMVNRSLADAVDEAVLVVAGQPVRLTGGGPATGPVTAANAEPPAGAVDLSHLRDLPTPSETAGTAAAERLTRLGPVTLGGLADVVRFAAATQDNEVPQPWRRVRALVLHGDHHGGAAAGAADSADRVRQLRDGTAPLAYLAGPVDATVRIVDTPPAEPIETGPAMPEADVDEALRQGWQLAGQAVDEGTDLIVLGSVGAGAETAAAAVTALLVPATDPAGLLHRVRTAEGRFDDRAWMDRAVAVRDALARVRRAARSGGKAALAQLGGPDLAVATGVLLGAATRRTPVLLDGPVGAAGALVARNLANNSRHWWLLPDPGGHPLVGRAGEVLNLTPVLDLRLDLGEGATALAALPLLRSALTLAQALPAAPAAG